MQRQKIQMGKKQFRIGDLAKELKVKKFVVRFWEKEFGLKLDRSEGGQRAYTADDLKMFMVIKDLLYKQGFTIAGAKKQLHAILRGNGAALMDDIFEENINPATSDTTIDAADLESDEDETAYVISNSIDDICSEMEKDCQPLPETEQHNAPYEEKVTPATVTSCDCKAVLEKVQALKEQLLQLKSTLK